MMEMEPEMAVDEISGVGGGGSPCRVLLISAGASHSVALLSGNVICSWGRGEDGQLGHGDPADRLFPIQLSALDDHDVTSITCGADHTIAYSESRTQVYSWGWGDFGRLGHGNSSDLFSPQPIRALDGVKIRQIACGDSHCLAVTIQGEVASWGRNQNGQLGLGTTEDSLVPQKLLAFQGLSIKMVAAGAEHSAAVTEDGHVYGWGWGRYGNLGLGDREDRNVPQKVASSNGLKMILVACGWRHTIAVSTSGDLYTYGWSKYGQLGHGDFEDHLVPHKLEALSGHPISQVTWCSFVQCVLVPVQPSNASVPVFSLLVGWIPGISGGWRHTMALTSDGKLYGWGWNKFGQVGVGDNVDRCSPVQVMFPHNQRVVQMCCGWRHSLAITERHNVFSWGRGTNGQLGLGDSFDRNYPTIIESLSVDGSCGQHIKSSSVDPLSGGIWLPPSERYAVVPDEVKQGPAGFLLKYNVGDASVPENDVKEMHF
ncbi:Ultraviolet-B receptor UVR8-like protein [Drosera capensis]